MQARRRVVQYKSVARVCRLLQDSHCLLLESNELDCECSANFSKTINLILDITSCEFRSYWGSCCFWKWLKKPWCFGCILPQSLRSQSLEGTEAPCESSLKVCWRGPATPRSWILVDITRWNKYIQQYVAQKLRTIFRNRVKTSRVEIEWR